MVAAGSGGSFIHTGFGFLTEPNHNLDEGRSISGARSRSQGSEAALPLSQLALWKAAWLQPLR